MKFFTTLVLSLAVFAASAQSVIGAWEKISTSDLSEIKSYMIIAEAYVVTANIENESGGFISARLEKWSLDSGRFVVELEFDTEYPEAAGGIYEADLELSGNELLLDGEEWSRVDEGDHDLAGAWKMSEVTLDGKSIKLGKDHPRREIKILSKTRFHWIDYDRISRTFTATGGGTYVFKDGVYTENIEFLTNEPEWVGSSLSFICKIDQNRWFHLGKGNNDVPIDEVWISLQ